MKTEDQRIVRRRELQRIRRAKPGARERKNEKERERYKSLPQDHPRKNRPSRHTKESWKRKAKKERLTLPDYVVSNRYLGLKVSECPHELIALKREVMRLNRMLGIQIHTI